MDDELIRCGVRPNTTRASNTVHICTVVSRHGDRRWARPICGRAAGWATEAQSDDVCKRCLARAEKRRDWMGAHLVGGTK